MTDGELYHDAEYEGLESESVTKDYHLREQKLTIQLPIQTSIAFM